MMACHTWHLHDVQVQQSGVLGAGASEERGETARMVNALDKTDMLRLSPGRNTMHAPTATGRCRRRLTGDHGAKTQASFVGAMAIADLVKTTLGPKGMVRDE